MAGSHRAPYIHWVLSASTQIPEFIVPQSNFGGSGTAPRGRYKGMSQRGVFDVAGNVREWQYNASGPGRHAIGGAWNDPTYLFTFAGVRDPLDRSPENGFRCAVYKDGRVGVLNFVTRIPVPVLMLNGKFDAIEPYESAQLPLYRLLQLPEGEKKHVVWDAAHGSYPPNEARREVLAWLERFFGAPGR